MSELIHSDNWGGKKAEPLSALIDLARLRQIAGNDMGFIRLLLAKANESNLHELAVAKEQALQGDWVALAKTVHRLKGAAQTICANKVETCCHVFEYSLLFEKDCDKIRDCLVHIEEMLMALDRCLKTPG